MKKLTLLLLTLASFITSFAQQGFIQGKLVDEKSLPLRFANVGLFSTVKGALPAVAAITDSTGSFLIEPPAAGTYFLQFTAIGFAKQQTDSFITGGPGFSKDFGTITIKSEAKSLQNVNITALRPTIVQLADRMVVSVEGTAMAAGNNAFNVLAKAPGVFIDQDGGIQLNGRGSVTVMIDGRLTHLSARDLRNLLETMSAENIKSIEIITNPSARYDAEGSSGIINIVLKKNTMQGINGSINAAYNYNFKQHAYSGGANVNVKSGKLNAFAFVDFNNRVGGREATFTRIFYTPTKNTYFDQVATGNFRVVGPPSVRLGADYDINSKHSLGGMFNFVTNTAKSDFLTDTYIGTSPVKPAQYIDANNYNTNTFKSYTGNLHYTAKLDTFGTTLSTDLDYARITNRGYGNYYNTFVDLSATQKSQDNLYTATPNGYEIRSGKIDFSHPFTRETKIDLGV
ncbi:MAG: TonB-dependent receptor [Flavisolibacter sp.]|nr:TonB-dependent receptor [Flavisolibacter sp.]